MSKHFIVSVVALVMISGCSKVSKENYDKIKTGMAFDEVETLLGKPEGCSETLGISNCQWKDGKATINITFINNETSIISAKDLR